MKIRVLLFEDHDLFRSLISSFLRDRGYEVFEFSEAGSCPLYLKGDCPCPLNHSCADIIISDIKMPGITGLDFIENQITQGCKVKHFAVMSFSWTSAQREQARKLGCHILEKPFEREDFDIWLNECEKTINPKRELSDWFLLKEKTDSDATY